MEIIKGSKEPKSFKIYIYINKQKHEMKTDKKRGWIEKAFM